MNFKEIIGHKAAKSYLQHCFNENKINHAYLFFGPSQVGKRTVALAFAKLMHCPAASESDSCGSCLSCKQILSGNDLDVQLINSQFLNEYNKKLVGQGITIDAIRFIRDDAQLTARGNSKKVYIVDEAERMTSNAANSLLKTLEEPHSNVVIFLISSDPSALLPTVRSRCHKVPFQLLHSSDIFNMLVNQEVIEEEAQWISAFCRGRPGYALWLAEDNHSRSLREWSFDLIQNTLSSSLLDTSRLAERLMEEPNDVPLPGVGPKTPSEKQRRRALWNIEILSIWLRDIASYSSHTNNSRKLINSLHLSWIHETSASLPVGAAHRFLLTIEEIRQAIIDNAGLQLALEVMFAKLVALRQSTD